VIIYRRLLPLLSRKAGPAYGPGETVDAVMLMQAVAMDMGTGYMFGLDRGTEFLGKDDEEGLGRWVGESLGSLRPRERTGKGEKTRLGWAMEMLPWLAEWIGGLFGEDVVPKDAGTGAEEIAGWFMEMMDGAEKDLAAFRAESGTGVCPGRVPVVLRHLEESVAERESLRGEKKNHVSLAGGHDCHAVAARKQTQKTELASELLDHLITTYDTVSTILTYLLWQLSHNEGYQVRLQDEMMDLKEPPISYPSAIGGLPSPKELDELPLLHAMVMETLRTFPVMPGVQSWTTSIGESSKLGCVEGIPGGVKVNAYTTVLHDNSDAFPEPERWVPERWLEGRCGWQGTVKKETCVGALGSTPGGDDYTVQSKSATRTLCTRLLITIQ